MLLPEPIRLGIKRVQEAKRFRGLFPRLRGLDFIEANMPAPGPTPVPLGYYYGIDPGAV